MAGWNYTLGLLCAKVRISDGGIMSVIDKNGGTKAGVNKGGALWCVEESCQRVGGHYIINAAVLRGRTIRMPGGRMKQMIKGAIPASDAPVPALMDGWGPLHFHMEGRRPEELPRIKAAMAQSAVPGDVVVRSMTQPGAWHILSKEPPGPILPPEFRNNGMPDGMCSSDIFLVGPRNVTDGVHVLFKVWIAAAGPNDGAALGDNWPLQAGRGGATPTNAIPLRVSQLRKAAVSEGYSGMLLVGLKGASVQNMVDVLADGRVHETLRVGPPPSPRGRGGAAAAADDPPRPRPRSRSPGRGPRLSERPTDVHELTRWLSEQYGYPSAVARLIAETENMECPLCTERVTDGDWHMASCLKHCICNTCWNRLMSDARRYDTIPRCPFCRAPASNLEVGRRSLADVMLKLRL